ncbi:hypothetical protein BGW80DRAFT_655443 [Lactifluus volemus]|nr:hypothetical protein BGW80DRAFT_655443 [Lactifluus volemus]
MLGGGTHWTHGSRSHGVGMLSSGCRHRRFVLNPPTLEGSSLSLLSPLRSTMHVCPPFRLGLDSTMMLCRLIPSLLSPITIPELHSVPSILLSDLAVKVKVCPLSFSLRFTELLSAPHASLASNLLSNIHINSMRLWATGFSVTRTPESDMRCVRICK